MTAFDGAVRVQIYRHFVDTGHAPTAGQLAEALGAGSVEVTSAIQRLADARVLVLQPRSTDIWMAMPFSAVPTDFRVRTGVAGGSSRLAGSREWWANCAWDALGIPALLDAEAELETHCAGTGEPITLRVTRDGVRSGSAVVHVAVPAAQWWEDIGFT